MADHITENVISIACTSPVIGLEYGIAPASPGMSVAVKHEFIRCHRSTVRMRQERVVFPFFVAKGIDENTFYFFSIYTFPTYRFENGEIELFKLGIGVMKHLGRSTLHIHLPVCGRTLRRID